eukprot:11132380-Karenia_brevis.AAC.1
MPEKWGRPFKTIWVSVGEWCAAVPKSTFHARIWRHLISRLGILIFLRDRNRCQDAHDVARKLQKYTPNARQGEPPWQWHWWKTWMACIHDTAREHLIYLQVVLDRWANEAEQLSASQRQQSWTNWAINTMLAPGAPAAHKFLRGPRPWDEFQTSEQTAAG